MPRTFCVFGLLLACVLFDAPEAQAQAKKTTNASKLIGKWRLDREATLALAGDARQADDKEPEPRLPFDFELELNDNGTAVSLATVGGVPQRRSARWEPGGSKDDGTIVLKFTAPRGLPKEHAFKLIDDDRLEFRASGAVRPLILVRAKQPPKPE